MFSFLKNIENLYEKLKKNKGLWFTTLTVLSVSGIFISMFFIGTMTSSTAEQVYKKASEDYILNYNNTLTYRYNNLFGIANIVVNDQAIKTGLARNNAAVVQRAKTFETSINQTDDLDQYFINVYIAGARETLANEVITLAMNQRQNISGVSIDPEGVFIKTVVPVIDNDRVTGAIEVKQYLSSLKREFNNVTKEFALVIKTELLSELTLQYRENNFKRLDDTYSVKEREFLGKFYTNAFFHKTEAYFDLGYQKDEQYFTVATKVYDLKGRDIGVVFLGEDSKAADGFVKQTKDLINSVTTVALGLVISMILFMF